jgi:hypothetical protein
LNREREREQMVQRNGQESEPAVVKMGVVQAGVLSPTLFNIFVNNIKYSASSLDELFRMINEDMVSLRTWLSANMLGT